jgi:Xaa-Pro aminopeptidase
MPHAVPTDREFKRGDFVTLDFGCVLNGYCSDMTRTVAVGDSTDITDEQRRVYDVILAAQSAGIAAVKAGVLGKDVHNAAAVLISDAGYGDYFGHGFGHGVGLEVHETPNASPRNDKPLPANAVISAEPGVYLPGKLGVRIEDLVVVRESGAENLTKSTKQLVFCS